MPSVALPKVVFFLLLINCICGENVLNNNKSYTTLPSNYTLDTIIHLEIKSSCQTLSDCSEGALECRKDNSEENNSYCVYPDYVCSSSMSCLLIKKNLPSNNNGTTTNGNTVIVNKYKNDTPRYPNDYSNANSGSDNNNDLIQEVIDQIQKNESSKFVINSCYVENTKNENDDNSNNSGCPNGNTIQMESESNDTNSAMRECSNDDNCQCTAGKCQINVESFTYYCNAKNTGYLCRRIEDMVAKKEGQCHGKEGEDCSSSSSTTTTPLQELKYVFISIVTLAAIVLLMVGLWIFNAKSKPLVDETDPEDFSVVIF